MSPHRNRVTRTPWRQRKRCPHREMETLEPLNITSWQGPFSPDIVAKAADALENGKLLYAAQLTFDLSEAERRFLSPDYLDGKSKNVSFRPGSGVLRGTR